MLLKKQQVGLSTYFLAAVLGVISAMISIFSYSLFFLGAGHDFPFVNLEKIPDWAEPVMKTLGDTALMRYIRFDYDVLFFMVPGVVFSLVLLVLYGYVKKRLDLKLFFRVLLSSAVGWVVAFMAAFFSLGAIGLFTLIPGLGMILELFDSSLMFGIATGLGAIAGSATLGIGLSKTFSRTARPSRKLLLWGGILGFMGGFLSHLFIRYGDPTTFDFESYTSLFLIWQTGMMLVFAHLFGKEQTKSLSSS